MAEDYKNTDWLRLSNTDSLFQIVFEDSTKIPFRLLSSAEYRFYSTKLAKLSFTEQYNFFIQIYNSCILDSYFVNTPDHLKAGVPTTIGRLVFSMSAPRTFEELTGAVDSYRKQCDNIEERMKFIICSTFPGYTLDELGDLPFPMLIKLFVGAEQLAVMRGGEPFELVADKKQVKNNNGKITREEILSHNQAVRR